MSRQLKAHFANGGPCANLWYYQRLPDEFHKKVALKQCSDGKWKRCSIALTLYVLPALVYRMEMSAILDVAHKSGQDRD
jgi:hypothetical protein